MRSFEFWYLCAKQAVVRSSHVCIFGIWCMWMKVIKIFVFCFSLGCHLWHLKPPTCSLLTKLKELNTKVIDLSRCVLALGEFSTLNSNSKITNSAVGVSTGELHYMVFPSHLSEGKKLEIYYCGLKFIFFPLESVLKNKSWLR